MTPDDLEQGISHYFGVTGPALVSYFELVHEYDRQQAWKADGARNVAEWLAGRFDLSPATAHADARLARRLAERPRLRRALADGELSLDKVRQLSRVTAEDARHHDDDTLVAFAAGCTYTQLRALVQSWCDVPADDANDIHARRSLRSFVSDDGLETRLSLRAPTDAVAPVLEAVRRDVERQPADAAEREPVDALACDALLQLACAGAEADRPLAAQPLVNIHVEASVLATGRGSGVIPGVGAVPLPALLQALCDSRIEVIVEKDGATVGISTASYEPTAKMRRALWNRDHGCRFPGCGRTWWVQAHHIHSWLTGGATHLHNLVLLCPHHHRLVDQDGWQIRGSPDSALTFDPPGPRRAAA